MKPLNVLGVKVVELEQMRDEIRHLFESLSEAHAAALLEPGTWSPLIDVCDANDYVTVRVELPGINPEQVSVTYADGILKISGEKREQELAQKNVSYLCMERSYGSFARALRVPWQIDASRATAKLVDGVLLIRLPKMQEQEREMRIEVSSE